MDFKVIEKKKNVIEIEFEDKLMPNTLLAELIKRKVDAYTFQKHPLLPGYCLHIEAKDAGKELKSAVLALEKDWKALKGAVEKAV
ncbi:hypothetical protein ACFLRC_01210 [Candidatus Altiarchaeota archaeon]